MMVGFSTGTLFKTHETSGALGVIKQLGCPCVEIGLIKMERFKSGWLDRVTTQDVAGFEYVSLHAPVIQYGNNDESRYVLDRIQHFHTKVRQLDCVVVHPNLIDDFSVLAASGLPIGIENMDWRKESFKNPDDFYPVFEKHPAWKLVLDLNHIFTNDPTMSLAKKFFQSFGDRIDHYHVSGFATLHDPLFETKQHQILEAIERLTVPVIDESGMPPEHLEEELAYLNRTLLKSPYST